MTLVGVDISDQLPSFLASLQWSVVSMERYPCVQEKNGRGAFLGAAREMRVQFAYAPFLAMREDLVNICRGFTAINDLNGDAAARIDVDINVEFD